MTDRPPCGGDSNGTPRVSFSRRTAWQVEADASSEAPAAEGLGAKLLDLTVSNPTQVNIVGHSEHLEELVAELGHRRAARYAPEPLGPAMARAAIARYYEARGAVGVTADRIVLSASTSEAYGWLFTLLADPGDDVLVASPGYPLFDCLADLHAVCIGCIRLDPARDYRIDFASLEAALGPRTRAIAVVSPNNPTGMFLHRADYAYLCEVARDRGLALIVDEVFLDYAWTDAEWHRPPSYASVRDGVCLQFVLSGASKVLGLPQAKVGWVVVGGPPEVVARAMERLTIIADTYLSVGAAPALALPVWLSRSKELSSAIRHHTLANLACLDAMLRRRADASKPAPRRLAADAGWYAVLQWEGTPAWDADELLKRAGVIVQPGALFDWPDAGALVVSLLSDRAVFEEATERMARL